MCNRDCCPSKTDSLPSHAPPPLHPLRVIKIVVKPPLSSLTTSQRRALRAGTRWPHRITSPSDTMPQTAEARDVPDSNRWHALRTMQPRANIGTGNDRRSSDPSDSSAFRAPETFRTARVSRLSRTRRQRSGRATSAGVLSRVPLLAFVVLLVGLPAPVRSQPQPQPEVAQPPPAPLTAPPPPQAPGLRGAVTVGSFVPTSVLAGATRRCMTPSCVRG